MKNVDGVLFRSLILFALIVVGCSIPASAIDLVSTDWLVTFETRPLGPVDVVLHVSRVEDQFQARTLGANVIAFDLEEVDDGSFAGPVVSGKPGPRVTMRLDGDLLMGEIDDGLLSGPFHGGPWAGQLPLRDYPAILETLEQVVTQKVYAPAELGKRGWKKFLSRAEETADEAKDDFDMLLGIKRAWKNDPFSHFSLIRSAVAAQEMIVSFDSMRIGRDSARVSFEGDVAVLTVDTMMGTDTIEQIDAAYEEIVRSGVKSLVIDLRENAGGAFAVLPLVQHVLREPLEAGTFLGNSWWSSHRSSPSTDVIDSVDPWRGWSIITFWNDIQAQDLLRIRFDPQEPLFDGQVFVVTGPKTASAAELAVDALRASGRARIVGEKTIGRMLSGSYFDVGEGFVVYLPVADYISRRVGRIDGKGLVPDVVVRADEALDRALALARDGH